MNSSSVNALCEHKLLLFLSLLIQNLPKPGLSKVYTPGIVLKVYEIHYKMI